MLNFLCVDVDLLIEDASSIIGVIVSIVIAVIFIISKSKITNIVNNSTSSDDDNTYPFSNHPNSTGQLTPEQRRYQSQLKQRQTAQKPTATTHAQGADGHAHAGTVESYDPIVGSLGEVSDEGCDELNGVRLIVTDLKYETDDNQTVYDLNAIRKSLIIGEVLNKPRFKHPYGRK